jgi:ATP-dependent Clp protease, protease subunit
LHINSPGGDVSEADAIYTALNAHQAKVNVYIDGLAASAASYIAMAGDTIAIAEHAKFMIHNAWGVAIGNAEEMRKLAGVLDKIDTTIRLIYQRRTGNSDKQLRDWMEAETWFTGQEAKASGFADKVIKAKEGASDSAFVDQMRMRVAVARAR